MCIRDSGYPIHCCLTRSLHPLQTSLYTYLTYVKKIYVSTNIFVNDKKFFLNCTYLHCRYVQILVFLCGLFLIQDGISLPSFETAQWNTFYMSTRIKSNHMDFVLMMISHSFFSINGIFKFFISFLLIQCYHMKNNLLYLLQM